MTYSEPSQDHLLLPLDSPSKPVCLCIQGDADICLKGACVRTRVCVCVCLRLSVRECRLVHKCVFACTSASP